MSEAALPQTAVRVVRAPADQRSRLSLWHLQGRLVIQDAEGDIQVISRVMKYVARSPEGASNAFYTKLVGHHGFNHIVVRAEIESVEWVSEVTDVDASGL